MALTKNQKLAVVGVAAVATLAYLMYKPVIAVPPACVGYEQYLADGSLIRGDASDPVYKMEVGKKRWIPDVNIFASCGFTWPDVHVLPQACVDSIPSGANVASCEDVKCKYPLTHCGTEAQPRACDPEACTTKYGSPEPGYYWTYANGCCIKTPYPVGCKVIDLTGYAAQYGGCTLTKPSAKLVLKVNVPLEIWNAMGGPWIHTVYGSIKCASWRGFFYSIPVFSQWKDGEICVMLNPSTYTICPPDYTKKTVSGWAGGRGGYLATRGSSYKLDGVSYSYAHHVKIGGIWEGETQAFTLEAGQTRTLDLQYGVSTCPGGISEQETNPDPDHCKAVGYRHPNSGKALVGIYCCQSGAQPKRDCIEWGYRKVCLGYGAKCDQPYTCVSRDALGRCTNWQCKGTMVRTCIQWGTEKYCVRRG